MPIKNTSTIFLKSVASDTTMGNSTNKTIGGQSPSGIVVVPYHDLPVAYYEQSISSLFYAPAWIQVMEDTYGFPFYTAWDRLTGHHIVFAVILQSEGHKIISLPFSDYIVLNPESACSLVGAVQSAYPSFPIVVRMATTKDAPPLVGNVTQRAYYHRVFTPSADVGASHLSASFRRGVQKARRSGVSIHQSNTFQALEEFYVLYHQLRINKFRTIPQPFVFFEQVWKTFIDKQQGFILQARRRETLLAAIIVLEYQGVWYYKFGCSRLDTLQHRPNNLLFAELIRLAGEQPHITEINLGLSGTDASYEGLIRFKEGMGGQRAHIVTYQLLPDGYDLRAEQNSKAVLSTLIKAIVASKPNLKTTDAWSRILYPSFL